MSRKDGYVFTPFVILYNIEFKMPVEKGEMPKEDAEREAYLISLLKPRIHLVALVAVAAPPTKRPRACQGFLNALGHQRVSPL